jgi:hypothetical protein
VYPALQDCNNLRFPENRHEMAAKSRPAKMPVRCDPPQAAAYLYSIFRIS